MSDEQPIAPQEDAEREMKRISRRSFIWAVLAVGGTYATFNWIHNQKPYGFKTPAEDGVGWPFRNALNFDDKFTSAIYSPSRLSPTYTDAAITQPRVNGDIGLGNGDSSDSGQPDASADAATKPGGPDPATKDSSGSSAAKDKGNGPDNGDAAFDPKKWVLHLERGGAIKPAVLKLEDIKALPRHEFVTEFKCIEGWSYFMKWAGARFSDFYTKYPPGGKTEYIALETPDGEYYVSIDLPAALHPQTLLCYEMNGQPLPLDHGAPLRLIIPHKYGVKNIKRIGKIAYVSQPPKDYWAEQGYDYYAGL
jgi:hypothetical protein